MSQKSDLANFVKDALIAGSARDEIADGLAQAGWSSSEVSEALDAYSDVAFTPPIPKPQNIVSARDFFIYMLTFLALGTAAVYLVILLHHLIEMYVDVSKRSYLIREIRYAMAALIVAAPTYCWLTLRESPRLRADPGLYRSAIRKWSIYIALLVAVIVFSTDLIVAFGRFLNGELTLVFALKVLSIAAVSGSIFVFYQREASKQP